MPARSNRSSCRPWNCRAARRTATARSGPATDTDLPSIDLEYGRIPQGLKDIYIPLFKALEPSAVVCNRMSGFDLPSNCVSVHVRNDFDWCQAKRTVDIDAFVHEMRRFSADTKFYLVAHNREASERLRLTFGNRVLELPAKNYGSLIDAVADLYIMSKCRTVINTYGSTFSEVSWWLGECLQKVVVVGAYADWGQHAINLNLKRW